MDIETLKEQFARDELYPTLCSLKQGWQASIISSRFYGMLHANGPTAVQSLINLRAMVDERMADKRYAQAYS